jgi:uncharacterized protein YjbI with pentapeptide repeats
MANQELVQILKQGGEVWNKWRTENIVSILDLMGADLRGTFLNGADLRQAFLYKAELIGANLSRADLHGADLRMAHLSEAHLTGAHLSRADLSDAELWKADLSEASLWRANLKAANFNEANLSEADLRGANLRKALLVGTDLSGANLIECNFSNAIISDTIFANSDLSETVGLEDVVHYGPSSISTDTIARSKGKIPEVFLRGCGLSDVDIEYAKLPNPELSNDEINKILYRMYDMRASQALQTSSLFISYSHGDSSFFDKLEKHLNRKGIRFWRDAHDLKSGRMEKQIDRAIRQNPTVLLILSEHSLKSDWVEHEVRTARELEKEMGRDVLCPVALDDSWKNSPWPKRVMEQVMEYNILDFSTWQDDSKFGSTFNKLIDGLELFYKA